MTHPPRRRAAALIALAAGSALLAGCTSSTAAAPAAEADFPKAGTTIEWIVPSAAGAGNDILARIMAPVMSEELGANIKVVNKEGGSQVIGLNYLASSATDGTTIGFTNIPSIFGRYLDPSKQAGFDRESFARIADWLDLNAVCYGDYSWNKAEWREPSPDGERALREQVRAKFGAAFAEAPFAALVNVALPEQSRVLLAPLAAKSGGWGQISENGWRDTSDPGYVTMRRLVEAAIGPLPGRDIAGTCGRDDRCVCGCCWVRRAARQVLAETTARQTMPPDRAVPRK